MPSSLATECTFQVNVMFLAVICVDFFARGLHHKCTAVACLYVVRTLASARLNFLFYIRHNGTIYRHRLAFMLYAYWYVKKLRSIGLKPGP